MAKKKIGARWADQILIACPIAYTICTDERYYKEILAEINIPEDQRPNYHEPGANGRVMLLEGRFALVTLHDVDDLTDCEIISIIVHESVHVWQVIRDYMGEESPSYEFEAYSVQGITYKLLMEYNRQLEERDLAALKKLDKMEKKALEKEKASVVEAPVLESPFPQSGQASLSSIIPLASLAASSATSLYSV